MRRIPFPLLVAAAANTFSFSVCAAFGGPFSQGPAAQVITHARTAPSSGTLALPSTRSGAVPGAGPMQGAAAMRRERADADARVVVDLAHGVSSATSPQRLRPGRCAQGSEGFGQVAAHAALVVDAEKRGAGQATVHMPRPAEGPQFLRVATSMASPETVVTCGDLVAPTP